jgi:signal transduction histidine kinase/ActR/RegA family two-component response regulator
VDYVSVPIIPELLRAKVTVFTELYRKTRDAERLNQELESRVAARTAELEQAVLQQTALMGRLRDADRRKDEFLALLAHELRNPLAALVNGVDIMNRKVVADVELDWCRSVFERQVRQLTRLVDDLLDVSRITLGKIKLRNEPVDVGDFVRAAVEASKPMIDERRHELTVTLPEEPLVVHGDAARLTQVVSNLLNNAAKYQDEGGVVGVQARREGEEVVVTVADAGAGISDEMLPRVFGLFVQGGQPAERTAGGLGVGLSLVKNVVELHGGSVEAESEGAGSGSTFRVRLPLATGPALVGRPAPPRTAPAHAAGGRAVLIVDDNVDAAEGLATLLRMAGHRVQLAHDGLAALGAFESTRPEVLLVDIGLPGMDGYELCRRVRASGGATARIIAVTGYGQERDRELAAAAGFDAHAVKPVDFDALLKLVERAPGDTAATGDAAPGLRTAESQRAR